MARFELEPAYILHSRAYRESSQLLEIISRDHGRQGLVARGARGSRSRWKNMLQPFRPLLLSWNQRGELGTLTGADQVASPPALQGESLFCALYMNELLMRLMQRGDPHPELFTAYQSTLAALTAGEAPQALLRLFERDLLRDTGFGLQLEREHDGQTGIEAGGWYRYLPESGPVRCDPANVDASQRVSGAALLALKSGQLEDRHLPELKQLMRRLIRHQLGDRPLHAQSLFS